MALNIVLAALLSGQFSVSGLDSVAGQNEPANIKMPPPAIEAEGIDTVVIREFRTTATELQSGRMTPRLLIPESEYIRDGVDLWERLFTAPSDTVLFYNRSTFEMLGSIPLPQALYIPPEKWQMLSSRQKRESEYKKHFWVAAKVDSLRAKFPKSKSDDIRGQLGKRDRMEDAFRIYLKYEPMIREIFSKQGIPHELTLLPIIESMLYAAMTGTQPQDALSSAKAEAIWQIVKRTADDRNNKIKKRYGITLNPKNPYESTVLASEVLLGMCYEVRRALRACNAGEKDLWAFTCMAYNCGDGETARLIRKYHGDFERVTKYGGNANSYFGPSSRSYALKTWAVSRIREDLYKLWPDLEKIQPMHFNPWTIYIVQKGDTISKIAEWSGIKRTDILYANGGNNKLKVGDVIYIPSIAVLPGHAEELQAKK